jgi:hypothetical protein
MNKKTLDEILRVSRRVAATSNESVKGWPVRFAKAGKRFPRSFIRIGLASLQYDRPVRRFERRASFLQCARNRFRNVKEYVASASSLPQKIARPKVKLEERDMNGETYRPLHQRSIESLRF